MEQPTGIHEKTRNNQQKYMRNTEKQQKYMKYTENKEQPCNRNT